MSRSEALIQKFEKPIEEDCRGREPGTPHPNSHQNYQEFLKVIKCYEFKEAMTFVIHDYNENGDERFITDPKYVRFSVSLEGINYDWILNFHQTWDSFNKKFGEALNMLIMRGYIQKI